MKIYLIELEPVETRYTKQWKESLPKQLISAGFDVEVISGPEDTAKETTPGAFLNFSETNYWKSEQLKSISLKFSRGEIKDSDYFLYTDAWNPTVIQLKYMSELLGIKIRIGGLWHAGSYDPYDFLGRIIGDSPWIKYAEKSMFECFDDNFYATDFHIKLFNDTYCLDQKKIHRVGWPMEYLTERLNEYKNLEKKNLILFPHRISEEKQLEIFQDLAKELPEYDFVVCQNKNLTKHEYHTLLGQSKMVFSANLQETLGISWYEGLLVDSIPFVPDRLSYKEMALDTFKYPSSWTINYSSYLLNKENIVRQIVYLIENYYNLKTELKAQRDKLSKEFFNGNSLYETIKQKGNK